MALKDAEEVGSKLLREVREERLDELLGSLRKEGRLEGYQTNWFGVPALDRITNVFGRRRSDTHNPPVVEITSGAPASGKTQLLYLLTAVALLPSSSDGNEFARSPGTVVVFDTDGRFNVERLAVLLRYRLDSTFEINGRSDENLLALVHNALKHVHVFRPQSLDSLVTSVQDLQTYLLTAPDHFSSDRALNLVVIDSISAFFWQDKLAQETSYAEAGTEAATLKPKTYHDLIAGLRELQRLFACSMIATSWGLSPSSHRSGQGESFKPLLPPAWVSFCSLKLVVERDPVKNFPQGMTIEQAKRDASSRQKIVEQGKFSAWVDQWNSGLWSAEIWAAVKATSENGAFSFQITDENVDVFR